MTVHVAPEALGLLGALLHTGVGLRIDGPMSVRALLTGPLGLDTGYVEREVSTIFLDGHPVDDIDAAVVTPGCELALSGPLPGVCGITMRRDSPVARMRSSIAYEAPHDDAKRGAGTVTLRMFNFVCRDAGRHALAAGVLVPRARLADALAALAREDAQALRSARRDEKEVAPEVLFAWLRETPDEDTLFTAISA
ncbi:hypothetical protein GGQ74_001809 [Desulfobaculum xiamenense]|uniref:Uncharacterized protein n=1 Tax=Desulfobaculum xiamenense TaxID=995050 RepID=A0A846QH44_9BACT|nr:hypothetical protein [Desulfobaculum xiamenense]NJB68136.1 hypothetical protein [Desulfobaculum xiamenense]